MLLSRSRRPTRTGRGAAAADLAWRDAKAELIELETGKRPTWAAQPPDRAESGPGTADTDTGTDDTDSDTESADGD